MLWEILCWEAVAWQDSAPAMPRPFNLQSVYYVHSNGVPRSCN